jgi:hypothetical protein
MQNNLTKNMQSMEIDMQIMQIICNIYSRNYGNMAIWKYVKYRHTPFPCAEYAKLYAKHLKQYA